MMDGRTGDDLDGALRACGVTSTTLAPAEAASLDGDGYVVLADAVDAASLDRLRSALEAVFLAGLQAPSGRQTGTRHANDLMARDAAFAMACAHPRVLAAVHHVLRRPFRLFQLGGRDPLPGFGQQGLHQDWLRRGPSDPFTLVTAIWLLDDFTPTNGSTRLIPGSHLLPRPLPKPMLDPAFRHRDEKVIVAGAGAILVLNGHLWHSGRRNESSGPRRVLQCQFVARDSAPPPAAGTGRQ